MKFETPEIIKIAAVITASPRWAGALMAAEGVPVPPSWLPAWRLAALICSVGMAVVEAFAFAFILKARREQSDRKARWLDVLTVLCLVDFAAILAPYVVANVSSQTLGDVLSPVLLWVWSLAVAASTILVVASVGFAQRETRRRTATSKAAASQSSAADTTDTTAATDTDTFAAVCDVDGCDWGKEYESKRAAVQARNAHMRIHKDSAA